MRVLSTAHSQIFSGFFRCCDYVSVVETGRGKSREPVSSAEGKSLTGPIPIVRHLVSTQVSTQLMIPGPLFRYSTQRPNCHRSIPGRVGGRRYKMRP